MATIKDVAEAAGVSIGTVDRILHNRGRFSEKTAEKVLEAVKELGYVPNLHARGLKKTKQYSFAAVVPGTEQDAGYWKMVEAGIRSASAELTPLGIDVRILHFDRYSGSSCGEVIDGALSDRPDGIMIAPVLPDQVRRRLSDAGVPYLFIDTDMPDMPERITYIGQDSFQSGKLSARLMSLLLAANGGGDRVLVIDPPGGNFHLGSRIDGFRAGMSGFAPDVRLQTVKAGSDDEAEFHSLIAECFEKPAARPDGIFAANSSVYYAATFLKSAGKDAASVPLIGYDLIPGRESLIAEGVIDFILTQQPEEQARRGIEALYDVLVLNRTVENEIIIPMNIVTRENLRTFTGFTG